MTKTPTNLLCVPTGWRRRSSVWRKSTLIKTSPSPLKGYCSLMHLIVHPTVHVIIIVMTDCNFPFINNFLALCLFFHPRRLETIFEVPLSRRDGSHSLLGQKRMKRFVEFPEVGVARKPRKPLVGAGAGGGLPRKAGVGSPFGRPKRGGCLSSKDHPTLNLQELDSLLCSKLDQLDSWLAFDQNICWPMPIKGVHNSTFTFSKILLLQIAQPRCLPSNIKLVLIFCNCLQCFSFVGVYYLPSIESFKMIIEECLYFHCVLFVDNDMEYTVIVIFDYLWM